MAVPRPPAPKPPAPRPAPNPPAPRPAPRPVPVPPAPRPNPARPPPIIVIPGPNPVQPAQPCYTQMDNANSCPVGGAHPSGGQSTSSSSNTGAIVGGVIGGLLALVALIVGGFFLARWRRQRREMKDAEAYYNAEPRSMSDKAMDDPDGVGASTAGFGAGANGDTESGQVVARSVALSPDPASPATTVGPFSEPTSSESKEKMDEKEKVGGPTSLSSSSRPATPAGLPPTIAHASRRSSIASTLFANNTTTDTTHDNTTTNLIATNTTNRNTSGPKEEWTPGSSVVPAILIDIPSSSLSHS